MARAQNNDLVAWLAVNVMGWHQYTGYGALSVGWFDKADCLQYMEADWNPLADDAHAQMVLDKMIGLGWDVFANRDCDGGAISCEFRRPNELGCGWGCERLGGTQREALCHAAKAAIEAERAKERDFHWCDDISKQGGSVSGHLDGAWHVSQNCEGIHNISYCPFCGEKL